MEPERFSFATGDDAIRERVVDRPERWNLLMAHVVLPPGDAVPRHPTDADAFVTVVRGTVILEVDGLPAAQHPRGSILFLPKGSPMAPRNEGLEPAEFFVVKFPHPSLA